MYCTNRMRKAARSYMKMHHRARGATRRRPLDHGDLRLLILALIAETPPADALARSSGAPPETATYASSDR